MSIALSLSTICFHTDPLDLALDRARELGFGTVDIGVVGGFCPHFVPSPGGAAHRREVVHAVAVRGLRVSSLNAAPQTWVAQKAGPRALGRVTEELLKLAAELRCPLVLAAGLRSRIRQCPADVYAEYLRGAVLRGREGYGVEVSVEAPHQGMLAQTVEETLDLLARIGLEEAGIAYDTSHIVAGGSDAASSLALLGERIRHVHLRDVRDCDIHLTPGDGVFDWGTLMTFLTSSAFVRPLVLELEYGGLLSPDQVAVEVGRAREFLLGVANGGGRPTRACR